MFQHTGKSENTVTDRYVPTQVKWVLTFCHICFKALSLFKKENGWNMINTAQYLFPPCLSSTEVTKLKLMFTVPGMCHLLFMHAKPVSLLLHIFQKFI